MMLPNESGVESTRVLDLDQSGLGKAYNQLIEEVPIVNGEKVLTLYRGTWEATRGIIKRNRDGHLYMILGVVENEDDQVNGWSADGNLTFIYSRLTDLPIPDASLDRVVGVYSADFFKFKEEIVKEVCRVLKPGGVFNILYFDQKDEVNGYYFEIKKENYIMNHE